MIKKAKYKKNGLDKVIWSPNTDPEEFFTDLIEVPFRSKQQPAGSIFINDERNKDGLQYWGKPTALAQKLAWAYPLGQGVVTHIRIIEWRDGNVLTILHTQAENHFSFDFWAGLKLPEEDEYECDDDGHRLKTFEMSFTGRTLGATGIMSKFVVKIQAIDKDSAAIRIYKTHEHVSMWKITEIKR